MKLDSQKVIEALYSIWAFEPNADLHEVLFTPQADGVTIVLKTPDAEDRAIACWAPSVGKGAVSSPFTISYKHIYSCLWKHLDHLKVNSLGFSEKSNTDIDWYRHIANLPYAQRPKRVIPTHYSFTDVYRLFYCEGIKGKVISTQALANLYQNCMHEDFKLDRHTNRALNMMYERALAGEAVTLHNRKRPQTGSVVYLSSETRRVMIPKTEGLFQLFLEEASEFI